MTKAQNNILAAVLRVSRVGGREGETFQSPGEQLRIIRSVAQRVGCEIEVFDADTQGAGVPGSVPFDQRPGMGAALRAVESGQLAGIIVSALDRLVREDPEKGVTLKAFQSRIRAARGVLIVADTPDATIEDPDADELTGTAGIGLGVRLLIDRAYREESGKKWKASRRNAVERGVHVGKVPFGYDRPERGHPLVPDPETADYLVGIFQRRATGASWASIAAWLNDEGVPKRYSDTAWTHTDVAKIAGNEVYRGIARDTNTRNEDAHEPLVDDELWYAVEGIRKGNREKTIPSKPTKQDAPIGGGFVRCGNCGAGLSRNTSTERDGTKFAFYLCRHCKETGISGKALEPYVYERIADVAVLKVDEPHAVDAAREQARADVATAEAAIEGFDATWVDQGLDPAAAISMRKALEKRLDQARTRLAELPADVLDWRSQVRDYARGWNDFFGRDVIDEERAISEVGAQFTEGVSGRAIFDLLVDGGDVAREVVRQNLKAVVVTGKSATRGKPETRESVEARVTVETL